MKTGTLKPSGSRSSECSVSPLRLKVVKSFRKAAGLSTGCTGIKELQSTRNPG
jgi:hypothetical protein